jgi:hypothetical protein
MPTFSGLWDGVHGDSYTLPPRNIQNRNKIRMALQTMGAWGLLHALDANKAPTTVAATPAGTDLVYPTGANPGITVTVPGANLGGVRTITTRPVPPDMTAAGLKTLMNVHKRRTSFPADSSGNGGPAFTNVVVE